MSRKPGIQRRNRKHPAEDADKETEASKDLFAMDTYMTLTAYGEHAQEAVDKAAERVEALDALLIYRK